MCACLREKKTTKHGNIKTKSKTLEILSMSNPPKIDNFAQQILSMYRPGQLNWGYKIMWKFQDFSVTQILREINFGPFKASKTVILT